MKQTEKSAIARARILDVTIELLASRGYAATSVQAAARAGDIRLATLQHHFPSKVDLMAAVVERYSRNTLEQFRVGLRGITGPRDRLYRMMEIAWSVSQTPELQASSEIALARRADPGLIAATDPIYRYFDNVTRRWVLGLARQAGLDLTLASKLHELNNSVHSGLVLRRAAGSSPGELETIARFWREVAAPFLTPGSPANSLSQ